MHSELNGVMTPAMFLRVPGGVLPNLPIKHPLDAGNDFHSLNLTNHSSSGDIY